MASFLPMSDADRAAWLTTFNTQIGQYAQQFGLTATDLATVQRDCTAFTQTVQYNDDVHQHARAVALFKKQLRNASQQIPVTAFPVPPSPPTLTAGQASGIFNRVVQLADRIRSHAAYTPAIGQSLGIVYPENNIDFNTIAPELTVRLDAGHPLLHWKKGPADGVAIYVDRRDGNGFVHLADTVKVAYLDTASLPTGTYSATWDYKIRYFIGDDEVGLFSVVISVNVIFVS